jgi:hypothetical protein
MVKMEISRVELKRIKEELGDNASPKQLLDKVKEHQRKQRYLNALEEKRRMIIDHFKKATIQMGEYDFSMLVDEMQPHDLDFLFKKDNLIDRFYFIHMIPNDDKNIEIVFSVDEARLKTIVGMLK